MNKLFIALLLAAAPLAAVAALDVGVDGKGNVTETPPYTPRQIDSSLQNQPTSPQSPSQNWYYSGGYNPYNLNQAVTQGQLQYYGTAAPGTGQNPIGGNLSDQPLEPLPSRNPFTQNGQYANLVDYLRTVYPLTITIGSLLAVILLTVNGVRYMLSDAFTDKDKAKKGMRNALWGLSVLVGSFLILYTLNPKLLQFNLDLPTVSTGQNQFTPVAPGPSGTDPNSTLGSSLTQSQQQAALKYANDNYGGTFLSWIGQYLNHYSTFAGSMELGAGDMNSFKSRCEAPVRATYNGGEYHARTVQVPGASTGANVDSIVCVY